MTKTMIKKSLRAYISISQKIRVKPTTHRNGISSAQNLQTAPFGESGIGNNPAKTAHPTKKKIAFVPVINNFFILQHLYYDTNIEKNLLQYFYLFFALPFSLFRS